MQFGDYRVELIPDTEFRLDGGAMFGVVPRALWSRVCPPDAENRITMNMNCVFIDTGQQRILIETGIGEKWSAKHTAMFGITRQQAFADSLRAVGVEPDSISIVINTHLHFDHAGGNTNLNNAGEAVPAFANARYFISRAEVEHAESPSERDRASYLPENWRPLVASGQLELKDANYEAAPGLHMETYAGHNRSMQCWRLDREGQTLFGFADLVPMRAHVPFAWIMGYDLYPVETLEVKKKLLPLAAREGWQCLFYHDPDQPLCRIVDDGGKLNAVPIDPRETKQL
ncbi:MAG TPA: MBL fold metallo-hydrolase [Pyrinomonadaceae bacterium]|jgi:glyoxylase-like metal-dependent hydrolase (beta-lactamase superfamily II)|nr:MBL fold metallo-hydrolase [Pyrinomonadaceae bacterium]